MSIFRQSNESIDHRKISESYSLKHFGIENLAVTPSSHHVGANAAELKSMVRDPGNMVQDAQFKIWKAL